MKIFRAESLIFVVIVGIVVLALMNGGYFTVNPGEVAVKIRLGKLVDSYEEGLYFMLTMHPQIMGVPSRSKMLDRLIQLMKLKGDVWFATPKQIAEYWIKHGGDKT